MEDGLLFLKYIGVFIKLSKLKTFINELRFLFSKIQFKSPRSIELS